jgi:hypothetical protein
VLFEGAAVAQETVLENKNRTDITLSGPEALVILELNEINSPSMPLDAQKVDYHKQLRSYVMERTEMESEKGKSKRVVAGFLVVMYDDGRQYVVEKVTNE